MPDLATKPHVDAFTAREIWRKYTGAVLADEA